MRRNKVSVHILDENYIVADDIRYKYSWDKKFLLHHYVSVDEFLKNLKSTPVLSKTLRIVIIVSNPLPSEVDEFGDLIGKIEEIAPGIPIINILNRNNKEEGPESCSKSNIIYLENNENSLMRIDNALKLFVARANVDKRGKEYRFYLYLFFIFFLASVIIYLLYRHGGT